MSIKGRFTCVLADWAVPVFHDEDTFTFQIGKGEMIQDGTDVAILSTGLDVKGCRLRQGRSLKESGITPV